MTLKHKMTRRNFIELSGTLATTIALASCGGQKTADLNNSSNKVVIWTAGDNGTIKDWSKDPILQIVEQKTNTKIQMVKISFDSFVNKVNASVASHQVPDIIGCYDTTAIRTINQWVKDKVVAPFEGPVASAAPDVVKMYQADPALAELKFDSKIYAQPVYWNRGLGPNANALYVRKDLIDQYKLQLPDTFDQYFDYVSQMKKQGLKGIVFGGKVSVGTAFTGPLDAFLGSVGLPNAGWVKTGGGYQYWAIQPAVKKAIKLFRRMISTNLIEDESWEIDAQHAEERFESGLYASYIGLSGGHTGRIQNAFETLNKGYQAWALPALDSGNGSRGYTWGPQFWGATFLGNLPGNNPVAAARVLNYLNSPEGLKLTAIGVEGKDYTEKDGDITFLPGRAADNFPSSSVGDTGAHPLATEIVSWVPQEWQDAALLSGHDQAFKDWYKTMWVNLRKYNVPGYGTIAATPKWIDFSSINNDLLSQTLLPMIKARSDDEADQLFDNFVKQWNSQGGADVTIEMSNHLKSLYK